MEARNEHESQAVFFSWIEQHKASLDGIELAHAVPNGGARHIATASKLKLEGVKAGVPDVLWPVARGGFIGLAIEFKHGDGNPSKEQRERIKKMQCEGWCVVICWDWRSAVRVVQGYAGMMKVQFS